MRFDNSTNKNFLSIRDKDGEITNHQILVCASSGEGKGLALEGIAEKFHANGYTVICIADPKSEVELGFQMFEPKAPYHIKHLRGIEKTPGKQKVKLYHPFTFDIERKNIPNFKIFTIPLKELGRSECSLLAETKWESDSVTLLLKTIEEVSESAGLYDFIHAVSDFVKTGSKSKSRKADPKNFYLPVGSGTAKELTRVSNYLQPFKRHYFLSRSNSPHKLNWKQIINDNEHYHVFTNYFMDETKDGKVMQFVILYLMQSIMRNKRYAKKPIVILTPELRDLCPFNAQGYKQFLAYAMKENYTKLRSSGKGISSISDTTFWEDLDKEIRGTFTANFFGKLTGDDIEAMGKKWGIKREVKEKLRSPEAKNTFIWIDSKEEVEDGIRIFLPKAMHGEPKYSFNEVYAEHNEKEPLEYPMVNYSGMIDEMRKELTEEEKKFKNKAKKIEEEEIQEQLEKKAEKEMKKEEGSKVVTKEKKVKELENKNKENVMKMCYEMYYKPESYDLEIKDKKKGTGSARDIATKLTDMGFVGVRTHASVMKNIRLFKETKQNTEESVSEDETKDFEDEFIEEEGGESNE